MRQAELRVWTLLEGAGLRNPFAYHESELCRSIRFPLEKGNKRVESIPVQGFFVRTFVTLFRQNK